MKKTIVLLLVLCLCIGLCACGKEGSAQTEQPEGWDRIAEATKTLNIYYNSHTEEEFKNILEKAASTGDIRARVENDAIAAQHIRSTSVRNIQYVGAYKEYDLFMVGVNYVYTEEYLGAIDTTTVSYYPEGETPTPAVSLVTINTVTPLKYEDGCYVVPADINLYDKLSQDYPDCECDAGQVLTSGDVACDTCLGTGHVETEPEAGSVGAALGHKAYITCRDCDGWGTKNKVYTDCTVCGGKGYIK